MESAQARKITLDVIHGFHELAKREISTDKTVRRHLAVQAALAEGSDTLITGHQALRDAVVIHGLHELPKSSIRTCRVVSQYS